jgi:protein-tyrosine-phosphatase
MGVAETYTHNGTDDSRRSLLLAAFAGAVIMAAGPAVARPRPPTVLFVCQFGSVKSAIARELFRRRATERRLSVNVVSRGITPQPHATPALLDQLRRDGIDPDRQPLTRLERRDIELADIVVIFDPLPARLARPDARDWTDTPSLNERYPAARNYLDRRIESLLDEVSAFR